MKELWFVGSRLHGYGCELINCRMKPCYKVL